jgi:hypothetical protein
MERQESFDHSRLLESNGYFAANQALDQLRAELIEDEMSIEDWLRLVRDMALAALSRYWHRCECGQVNSPYKAEIDGDMATLYYSCVYDGKEYRTQKSALLPPRVH